MGKDSAEIRTGKERVMDLNQKPCLFEEALPWAQQH